MKKDNLIEMPSQEKDAKDTLKYALTAHEDHRFNTVIVLAIDKENLAHFMSSPMSAADKSYLSDYLKASIMVDLADDT